MSGIKCLNFYHFEKGILNPQYYRPGSQIYGLEVMELVQKDAVLS
jgi:hypothetical protein